MKPGQEMQTIGVIVFVKTFNALAFRNTSNEHRRKT